MKLLCIEDNVELVESLKQFLTSGANVDCAHTGEDGLLLAGKNKYDAIILDLARLAGKARPQFWYKTLPAICKEMQHRIELSRQALRQAGCFTDMNIIGTLLDTMETSLQDTLAQQSQAENFLKQYEQKAATP